MKKITPAIMLLTILAACTQPSQEKSKLVEKEVKIIKKVMDQPDSVLRHQVYFGFKESASAAEIQRVITAFRDLQFKIDGIEEF